MYEVKVTDHFSAAHQLRGYDGACEKLHGHNWRVDVVVESPELDSMGVVVDFEEVKKSLRAILEEYDHRNMNDVPSFKDINPTAEHIARTVYSRLNEHPGTNRFKITSVTVWETKDACATYRDT